MADGKKTAMQEDMKLSVIPPPEKSARSVWPPAIVAILLVWVFYFFTKTGVGLIIADGWQYIDQRAVVMAFGIALSLLIVVILEAAWNWPVWAKIILIVVLACVVAIPYAAFNWLLLFYLEGDLDQWLLTMMASWGQSAHLYLAITVVIVATQYSTSLLAREERMHAMETAARTLELRALRYQVNPHFLFNVLNSVAALVSDDERDRAQTMLANLAAYYRTSLTLDPMADVTLKEEIAAQLLYIEIERVRFPDRLAVEINIPSELETVLVPSLILQPIVENSVKHSVATSSGQVLLAISAKAEGDNLQIIISDRVSDSESRDRSQSSGTSTGLRNVRARLNSRFGEAASVNSTPTATGYETTLVFPVEQP